MYDSDVRPYVETCKGHTAGSRMDVGTGQPVAVKQARMQTAIATASSEIAGVRVAPPPKVESSSASEWSLPRVLGRDSRLRRYLACADMAACSAALMLALKVVRDDRVHYWAVPMVVALVVPLAKLMGLYDRDDLLLRKSTLDEGPKLLRLGTACTLWIWIFAPLLAEARLGRNQILVMWAALVVLLLVARAATRMLFNRHSAPERCLVVGEPSVCDQIDVKLESGRGINAVVALALQFVSPEEEAFEMGELAQAGKLRALGAEHDLHRLVIAPHDSDAGHIRDLVRAANGLGLHVSIVPRMLEVIGSTVQFDDLGGLTVMGVQRFGLARSSRLLKRAMDLAGSLAGIVLLAPVWAAIAIAIKLDSRGPVLFGQRRVGEDGRVFRMLKFRTMVNGADDMRAALAEFNEAGNGLFKIENDPRTTRVGRLLRSLSLDELPQLVNVLKGEMSLVGPRPLVVYEDEHIEGFYRERLTLTPGMTGRWQILGSARIPLSEMVKLDYLYVANWSLWSDVKILLRTVPFVLGRRGL